MSQIKIFKQSLPYSIGVLLYVSAVATGMQLVERIFSDKPDSFLAPIGFLMLLVTSAAVMAVLVFGKAITLYLEGKKLEGVATILWIIGQIAIFTVLAFVIMFFVR